MRQVREALARWWRQIRFAVLLWRMNKDSLDQVERLLTQTDTQKHYREVDGTVTSTAGYRIPAIRLHYPHSAAGGRSAS